MPALFRLTIFVFVPGVLTGQVASAQPVIKPMASKVGSRMVEPKPTKAGIDFFESKIRPVLVRSCYKCHSGDPAKAKGHFVLDTHDGLRKGGDSGEVISPGHPEKSLLIEAVNYEGLEMPPEGKLADEVLEDFRIWVEMGAPDPRVGKAANAKNKVDLAEARRFWAFQQPKPTPVPPVHDSHWPISDIDRFVLARLERESLKPVTPSDPVTLIRRLTFDLTGLPPTPQEIDDFVNDKSGSNVTKAVDRLLNSPRFGERWGRHWLDVVRYAESTGKERNLPYRYAWRYRDYVIDSFNADKPYDRFIIEQLAGDLIQAKTPAEHATMMVATGFLAIGPKSAQTKNPEQFRVDVIDDQIDVTGRAFLAMTIACARCHDHKFDPIPQTDYYALAGIFHSTETLSGIKPDRKTVAEEKLMKIPVPQSRTKSDESKEEKDRRREIASIENQLAELRMVQKQGNKKQPNAKGLPGKMAASGRINQKSVREHIKKLEDQLEDLDGQVAASDNLAMGVREGEIGDYHLLVRGELKEKGPDVPRGVLTVLKNAQTSHFDNRHSGRMQLALWIADRSNPLTARVMVNRVWAHLFGEGLVDTVDNFGGLGNEPSHPELLDTLALQFMNQKWSVKKLIRSIVLSRVYQLSSDHDETNYDKDPGNRFLWRMSRRRLDAEEIRDAMLMASGQLDLNRPEGSPVMELSNRIIRSAKGLQDLRKPTTVRSVFLPYLRGIVPEMLSVFDVADPNLIVGKRDITTVPTQALFLMNNPVVLKQSEEMAKRVLKPEGLDQNGRIELAYRLALGRPPTNSEVSMVSQFMQEYRKAAKSSKPLTNPQLSTWSCFCQTLFQSALFRYVY